MDKNGTIRHLLKRAPVTAREDDDLAMILQIMRWAEVRHLPIVRGDALLGVISERDVLRRLSEVGRERGSREEAGTVMSSPPITIGSDEPVDAAVEMILGRRIGCLPVIERSGLIGIVTRSDLLDREASATAAEPPSAERDDPDHAAPWTRLTVDAVMSLDPVTASADDPLSMIVERMGRLGIRHVPVVDGERRVIGVLSDRDVRTAIGNPMRLLRAREAVVRIESTRVAHAMSRSPVTIAAGTRLSRVAELFVDRKVGILPVVNGEDRLVGIVSYADVLRAVLGPKAQAN